jgi:uncharacterized membrane protein
MSKTDRPISSDYLERVGHLLSDIDEDDRVSLLAELADQLEEVPEAELNQRLGTPEEFVAEYRRSAGLDAPTSDGTGSQAKTLATVVSVLALPLGVLVFFSFGGQLVFGWLVLAAEWALARISPQPLRITWSVLAGVLVAQVLYLAVDTQGGTNRANSFIAIAVIMIVGALVALLFYRTTSNKRSGTDIRTS